MNQGRLDRAFARTEYITLRRAAEMLGLSTRTVRRYLALGILTETKQLPSGHHRVDRELLLLWESELIEHKILGESIRDERTLDMFPHLTPQKS